MLDMGPYYITTLVNLLGPVARVAAHGADAARPSARSPASRARGEKIDVEVPTHVAGTLEFAAAPSSSIVDQLRRARRTSICRSSSTAPTAAWSCPIRTGSAATVAVPAQAAASGRRCRSTRPWTEGNLRSLGLADMAARHPRGPAAPGIGRAGAARARGDGGVRALGRERPVHRDRDAAGAAAAARRGRAARLSGGTGHEEGADRLGRLERPRAARREPSGSRRCSARRASRSTYGRGHRGLRRSRPSPTEPDRADHDHVEDREGRSSPTSPPR